MDVRMDRQMFVTQALQNGSNRMEIGNSCGGDTKGSGLLLTHASVVTEGDVGCAGRRSTISGHRRHGLADAAEQRVARRPITTEP